MTDTLTILADAEAEVAAELSLLYAAVRTRESDLAGIRKAQHEVRRSRERMAAQGIETRSATDAKRRGPKGESPVRRMRPAPRPVQQQEDKV